MSVFLRKNSVLLQGHGQCRVDETRSASGACPVSGYKNFVLHQGMSSVRGAEIYHRFWAYAGGGFGKNFVLRQVHVQWRLVAEFVLLRGHIRGRVAELCPASGGMSSDRVAEFCPASGVFSGSRVPSMSSIRGVYCSLRTCRELVHF
ncbi:hypothetical protein TNIN_428721 [Trichonephila inaurata madagascariensis]|uniref:Uncharacterized protein n=1 Tax=Trichonephila inaurata madagascariensis TaxID=2747483 RepID=A0A8X7CRK2_9ARAC|nr:hypothetical protein TNIN_428721 [Trichonephila inaurata madagascariensis]